jgi:hypothetical protein
MPREMEQTARGRITFTKKNKTINYDENLIREGSF